MGPPSLPHLYGSYRWTNTPHELTRATKPWTRGPYSHPLSDHRPRRKDQREYARTEPLHRGERASPPSLPFAHHRTRECETSCCPTNILPCPCLDLAWLVKKNESEAPKLTSALFLSRNPPSFDSSPSVWICSPRNFSKNPDPARNPAAASERLQRLDRRSDGTVVDLHEERDLEPQEPERAAPARLIVDSAVVPEECLLGHTSELLYHYARLGSPNSLNCCSE